MKIEDYAIIGDTQTVALVGRQGGIDWLCLPRFDSRACFAALLGTHDHGCWRMFPRAEVRRTRRCYRDGTLVLQTEFETEEGCVRLIDFMPPRDGEPDLVRIVEGVRGRVPMRMELAIRFDYGSLVPWVQRLDGSLEAVAGPDALSLRFDVETHGEGFCTVANFEVGEGERRSFVMVWYPSHERPPEPIDPGEALADTESWWREWSGRSCYRGEWEEAVRRSLITLKALTYAPTGGIVAAATTSLPECLGGVRNWDYRFCWIRDATFTLLAFLESGYLDEAAAWRDWMLRAVAGDPKQLQLVYGPAGERRLTELELDWLPGYEDSRPVRIGNAAHRQFQLDVFGELMDAMHEARTHGMEPEPAAWNLQRALIERLECCWTQPDHGIWEVRAEARHFTHSKVMAWVAADRAVRSIENYGLEGPVERWRELRARIHEDVCRNGYDDSRGAFTQTYGSDRLDASLLMIPLVGFLPADDPRVAGTVEAIERELMANGLVHRYASEEGPHVDGLPPGEGTFLLCSFWLADCRVLLGRRDDARELFERLLDLRNDVGLLAEEYDPRCERQLGNFPQAFSHVGLVNTAHNLSREEEGPAERRGPD